MDVPEGSIRPQLITAPQPARQGSLQTGSVSVSFEISEKGVPFNIKVDKSSNEALEAEVIALIREWRFEAAMR
ncbi:MAG: energy transducer TonB, partial [Acidobacteriota bacterium]|nr:energy transducer TonB [Acidobacteriota bacterium]